jgi:NAD(P)-dependent dehydrogenase (short-subunit alcohol dehydrogenase family)
MEGSMISEAYSVKDKVAIITGGGTGIGKHIALRFAEAGDPVVIASRNLENLESVRKEIESGGGRALAIQCDVRDPDAVQAVVDATVAEFGRIDVMVNNHGASFRCDILDMSPNGWNTIVAINLNGTFLFCRAAGRVMRDQGSGAIVNIASTAGTQATPAMAHYAAAKAGVINFTKSLADELAPHNIRVNCVTPGPIITEGFLGVLEARGEVPKDLGRGMVMDRWGECDEIAYPVLFLASDASGFMTGANIIVDGGGRSNRGIG